MWRRWRHRVPLEFFSFRFSFNFMNGHDADDDIAFHWTPKSSVINYKNLFFQICSYNFMNGHDTNDNIAIKRDFFISVFQLALWTFMTLMTTSLSMEPPIVQFSHVSVSFRFSVNFMNGHDADDDIAFHWNPYNSVIRSLFSFRFSVNFMNGHDADDDIAFHWNPYNSVIRSLFSFRFSVNFMNGHDADDDIAFYWNPNSSVIRLYYTTGLKGPQGASSNRIARPSVCMSVCPPVIPSHLQSKCESLGDDTATKLGL